MTLAHSFLKILWCLLGTSQLLLNYRQESISQRLKKTITFTFLLYTGNNSRLQGRMSYYRYITGINRTFRPPKRALRSSSVPRHVPDLDATRYSRSSSVPPTLSFSSSFYSRNSATPFRDRALSVPPRYSRYKVKKNWNKKLLHFFF